jgi:cell division protein FtsB
MTLKFTTHLIKIERPYYPEEIKELKSRKNSLWQNFENFGMKWIGVTLVFLAPLLVYDKFVGKVSSETQLLILIPLQIIAVGIVIYWMNRNGQIGWNKKIENEIKNGKAQILKIETDKVFKRKETYDLGSGFYIKISDNQTLFLQGQYFDQLQYSRKFPNTDFEIVRTNLNFNELIDIKSFGKYLKPEKKLNAFTKEQFERNEVHYDGDILNIPIEQIE